MNKLAEETKVEKEVTEEIMKTAKTISDTISAETGSKVKNSQTTRKQMQHSSFDTCFVEK